MRVILKCDVGHFSEPLPEVTYKFTLIYCNHPHNFPHFHSSCTVKRSTTAINCMTQNHNSDMTIQTIFGSPFLQNFDIQTLFMNVINLP